MAAETWFNSLLSISTYWPRALGHVFPQLHRVQGLTTEMNPLAWSSVRAQEIALEEFCYAWWTESPEMRAG